MLAQDAFARLEARAYLRNGAQSDDSTVRHHDGMIFENGVDRRNGKHPAGFDQEICGFQGHCAPRAKKTTRKFMLSSISNERLRVSRKVLAKPHSGIGVC
jgi:hypothetical protein